MRMSKLELLKSKLSKEEMRVKRFGEKLSWYETKLETTLFQAKQYEQIRTYLKNTEKTS
jgi:hypothetical protein